MILYAKCVRNAKVCHFQYSGYAKEDVTKTLTDLGATTIAFIDQDEYDAAIASRQPNRWTQGDNHE